MCVDAAFDVSAAAVVSEDVGMVVEASGSVVITVVVPEESEEDGADVAEVEVGNTVVVSEAVYPEVVDSVVEALDFLK